MELLLFGAGSQALVDLDLLSKTKGYRIRGVIDQKLAQGSSFAGHTVLGGDEDMARYLDEVDGAIVSIGDNWTRFKVVSRILNVREDISFPFLVHPFSYVADNVTIGPGSRILAGSVVNTQTKIGSHSIINTRSSLDHENTVGDFCSIMPGVAISGNVRIGDFTAVGTGAAVIHDITIGEHTVIGAGATVVRDIPPNTVAYGTPARVARTRREGEPYL